MTTLRLLGALGALALSSAGCGLISSDVSDFDLQLSSKDFTVDTSGWQVTQSEADLYLGTTCDPNQSAPNVCSSTATTACPMNCSGSCDPTAHTCDLGLEVAVHQPVDLLMEHPELKTINSSFIHVTIDDVAYAVSDNTLNVATPVMKVYVAPMSVMDPNDPSAMQIGTIAAVPAGMPVASAEMMFTDTGKAALIQIMGDYKNPFNIIVGSELMLEQGDQVPTGKLDANVNIKAHASP